MNPFKWVSNYWKTHGTKILGFGSAIVGAIEYIDHQTVQLIESTFGPKHGPVISHIIMVVAGLLTAYRGFSNSAKAAALPAPDPNASRP